MNAATVLTDAFGRIHEAAHQAVQGLSSSQLALRLDADANPVSWLAWHLARVQDDHVAAAAGIEQVWTTGGWWARMAVPVDAADIGYGHDRAQVAAVADAVSDAALLLGYLDATHEATLGVVAGLSDDDLDRIVDERWDPPVTMGVRLVSVVADNLQHAGQAAYLRGLLMRR